VKLKIVVIDVSNSRGIGEVGTREIWEIRGPRTNAKKAGKLLRRDLGVRRHKTLMRQVGTTTVWNVTALL
jgi:hypothetical protein